MKKNKNDKDNFDVEVIVKTKRIRKTITINPSDCEHVKKR